MRIVATVEIQLPDIDEESKGQIDALEALKNDSERMIQMVWMRLERGGGDVEIHSPEIKEGSIYD